MAGSSDVKRRIKSVENTRKITRTMELVATSKLKKATDRVRAVAPYSDALVSIVGSLYAPELSEKFPLLRSPEKVERAAVLLLTANRGLAGGFNANLIKETRLLLERLSGEGVETDLHIVGKKGIAYFRFRGRVIESTRIDIGDNPSMEDAESVIAGLREDFAVGRVDAVHVVSSEFVSSMSTPPRVTELLPIQGGEWIAWPRQLHPESESRNSAGEAASGLPPQCNLPCADRERGCRAGGQTQRHEERYR